MKYIFFFWFSFSLFPTLSNAIDCSPLIGNCDYYLCREKEHPCGDNGYYVDFAYKYCKKSEDELSLKLNDQGKEWINDVAICLQQSTDKIAYGDECSDVYKTAVMDHERCYNAANFCGLDYHSRLNIIMMLKNELYRPLIVKQGLKILNVCRKSN